MGNRGGHASCIGATIGGYEVLSHIGRGAMGAVYLARDVKLNRRVALKVLLGSLARHGAAIRQFHLEAQAAAPLRHANIVRIYAAGVDEGIPYIAMEYVDGEPLDRFLRRKGPIAWQNALFIAQQVAEALDCAHRSGVVHRDIKPANIMLDRRGCVRLADFGIASVREPNGSLPEDTGKMATPQYMAPEQCSGRTVGPASDLFALGVTLYHMLTGEMPFQGESAPALIKCITNDEPPRVNRLAPDIPDDVARLVAHLLAKRPEERPENARAVCERIDAIQGQKGGVSAMPAALTAFIKEQAEPRPVESDRVTPKPRRRSTIQTRQTSAVRRRGKAMRPVALAALLLAALTVAFASTSYSFATRGASRPERAAPLDAVRFRRLASPMLAADLGGDAFAFENIAWIGDSAALLVRVGGRPGALTQGLHAAMALEPDELRALTVLGPQGSAVVPPSADGFRVASFAVPAAPPHSPFHNAVLMEHRERTNEVILVAQRWGEAVPRPQVLGRVQAPPSAGETLWKADFTLPVAASPDGVTLCFLLSEPDGGAYLVQRDVRDVPVHALGERLTSPGAPIIPQSIRYSPNGAKLLYIRDKGPLERELWVVDTSGGSLDGVPLMVGALADTAAFDPTGRRVAVNRRRPDGDPDIYLLRISSSPEPVPIGRGLIGPESWAPSGSFIVATARAENEDVLTADPSTLRQLYAVSTAPPYDRTRLTDAPGGIRSAAAVSRDGTWAAAVGQTDVPATVVFVDLHRAHIGAVAAKAP